MTGTPLVTAVARGPGTGAILDRTHEILDQLWRAVPAVSNIDRAAFVTAVAEVVGNIVAHGPTPPPETCVELSVWPDRLQARVSDDGAPVELPGPAVLPDVEATSGRGLPLMAALAAVEFRREGDCNVWDVVRARGVGPTTLG